MPLAVRPCLFTGYPRPREELTTKTRASNDATAEKRRACPPNFHGVALYLSCRRFHSPSHGWSRTETEFAVVVYSSTADTANDCEDSRGRDEQLDAANPGAQRFPCVECTLWRSEDFSFSFLSALIGRVVCVPLFCVQELMTTTLLRFGLLIMTHTLQGF